MKNMWRMCSVAVLMTMIVAGCGAVPPKVPVEVISRQTVEQTVSCTGTVQPGAYETVTVPIPCSVGEILAQEGQTVRAGDPILRLDKAATCVALAGRDRSATALTLSTMADTVTAPCDGVLSEIKTEIGDLLQPGEPIALIAPYAATQIRIAIKEKDLKNMRVGQKVYVSGAAFEKSAYEGTLTEIASVAHLVSTTGETVVDGVVSLLPDGVDSSLRLGLTAKAKVVVDTIRDGLVVPFEAIATDDSGREYVWVADGGTAHRRFLSAGSDLPTGVLQNDDSWLGAAVILRPDHITGDGVPVIATAAGE